jgi:dephospho-CoA kinase
MYAIGLTGGIAGGKSAVAAILDELGAHVIVADEIAREQVAPGGAVLGALVSEFGRGILRDDGTLDRRRLGRDVFDDPVKLERLNAITHPALVREIIARMESLGSRDPEGVVVLDAALLLDWDLAEAFDLVLSVHAPAGLRVARLVSAGLAEDEARARIAAQLDDARFAAAADEVIDNSGTLEELRDAVLDVWERVVRAREEQAR